jgi:hypothetical protein
LSPEADTYLKKFLAYYFDYDELVEMKRLWILEVDKPIYFAQNISLSSVLITQPTTLLKLKKFIGDMPTYMSPLSAHSSDARLCSVIYF